MSDDGADLGVDAKRALGVVLGGDEQPTEEERKSVAEMRETLLAAPIESTSYEGTANACARLILEAWEKYPNVRDVPSENEYLRGPDGKTVLEPWVSITKDLHPVLKEIYKDNKAATAVLSDLTGFMWGWAVNAARRCSDMPQVPNPAIVTIHN